MGVSAPASAVVVNPEGSAPSPFNTVLGLLKKATAARELHADIPVNRLRNCRIMPFYDEVRAVKTALFLEAWMEESALDTSGRLQVPQVAVVRGCQILGRYPQVTVVGIQFLFEFLHLREDGTLLY